MTAQSNVVSVIPSTSAAIAGIRLDHCQLGVPKGITSKREIAFIDRGIDDLETLRAGIRPDVEAILLSDDEPAVRQMARAVQARSGLKAIHIVVHGQPGTMAFSAGLLSLDTLDRVAGDLAHLGSAITRGGELRLWSCAVAQGEHGAAFIDAIAAATGAKVVASAQRLGAAIRGGNWDLSSLDNPVFAEPPITAAGQRAYAGVLDTNNTTISGNNSTNTLTVTGSNDKVSDGNGTNSVTVTGNNNTISDGNGTNTVTVTGNNNTVSDGNGANTITVSGNNNTISDGNGSNTIIVSGSNATISDGNGGNLIYAANTTGTNTISDGNGSNVIVGGSGTDTINAGNGSNIIYGGAGSDTIKVGNGSNIIMAGAGSDTVTAGNGSDLFIYALSDHYQIVGSSLQSLSPAGDVDKYSAGGGNDTIRIVVTAAEYALISTNLASYAGWLVANQGNSSTYSFSFGNSGSLSLNGFEALQVQVVNTGLINVGLAGTTATGSLNSLPLFNDTVGTSSVHFTDTYKIVGVTAGTTGPAATSLDPSIQVAEYLKGTATLPASYSNIVGQDGTLTVNADGTYSYTVTSHTTATDTFTLTTLDQNGFVTSTTLTFDMTPTGGAPDLVDSSDSGALHTDNITNVTSPTFRVSLDGSVALGDKVELWLGGSSLAHPVVHIINATDLANHYVDLTVTSGDLGADGVKSISAHFTDRASNSSTTGALQITLDTTNPAAGMLSFSNLTDTGTANTPPVTTDNSFDLTLSGQGDTNGIGGVVYEKSINGGATWTTTAANQSGLADGDYLFHAVVTDNAGNSSTTSAIEVKVDNTAPTAGTLTFSNLTDTGSANTPPVTTDNNFNLTLSGQGDTNGIGGVVYEKSINGGATWTTTAANQSGLADGDYLFHAVVTDNAGNSSTTSAIEVKVDNTAPAAGTLAFANLTDTGSSDPTPITKDGTFDLSLSGNADLNGTSVSYEVSTDGGATWSTTSANQSTLADGTYSFHAVVTDPAGNSSTSNAITVTVDNTAPAAGTLAFANLTDTGSSDPTPITKDGTFDLSLSGNADLNGTSVSYEVSTDGGATWSTTSANQSTLADGTYSFHAVVTDPAGNSSTSNAITVTVDNTAPAAGTLAFANLTDTGSSDPTPITKDGTFDLSLSGNADLNGTSVSYEVSTDGGATWSTTSANQSTLADGTYSFHAVVTDPAGNSSTSNAITVTVDNTAPAAGTLAFANLTDTGSSDPTPITKDGTFDLSLSGNADLNGTSVSYEVSTDGGATWSTTSANQSTLADGTYSFHAVVTDPAGNSSTSNAITVTVDNTAPAAGTLAFANLTDTGSSDPTPITKDGTFDLSLSGNADLNGTSVSYEVSTDGGATWSTTSANQSTLADGTYSFHAVVTDPAGNSSTSNAITVTVDNTAPAAGTLAFANLTDTGSSDPTPITKDGTFDLSLSGNADLNGTSVSYEVSTDGGATWSTTSANQSTLADGTYSFHAVVTDPAGNSSTSNAITVTVDNTAPAAGTLAFANLTDTGSSDPTPITKDGTFDLSLSGNADLNGTSVSYEVSTDGGATWSTTSANQSTLADGTYSFHAVVTDPAGNSSTSNAITVTVDNTAPAAGTLAFANLTDTGSSDPTPITKDGTFDLSLSGNADLNGTSVSYEVSTDGGATWSTTSANQSTLADGTYSFHAVVTDPAGNSSTSNAITVTVDNTAPAAGTLAFANLTDTGSSDPTPITKDGTFDLSLSGNADLNGTSVSYEVSTDGGATWSTTSANQSTLADGTYSFHAVVTDPAGNSSTSNAITVTVDNTAPAAGTLAFANLTDTGSSDPTPITKDGTFDLSLSGNADLNGTSVSYEVSTDGGATWSTTSANQSTLADGTYSFHAVVTDPAGNSSTSNAITVTVDNTAPAAGTLAFANLTDTGSSDPTPITKDGTFDLSLSGNADLNGTSVSYEVSTDGGATWSTTSANQSTLADGTYSFHAVVTDPAGNSSTSNAITVTVDNTAPAAGTLAFANLTDTGSSDPTPITKDGTFDLSLSGNADLNGTSVSYEVSTDGGATWSTTSANQSTLADGTYSFHAVVTDPAGNSSTSNAITVTVDNTAPAAGTLAFANLTDTGSSDPTPITKDGTFDLSLSGNADLNGTSVSYEVSTDGGATWSTTSANQSTLADGTYSFHAVVTDPAGNSSTSNAITVTVDNTAPAAGTLAFANLTDTGSSDPTPITKDGTFDLSLSGNADLNGTSVSYEVSTDGGATWSTTSANQSTLADGTYSFHAVVTDPAGNSSTSNAITVTVDNTAPAAPTGLDLNAADDTGSSSADNITKNTSALTISGSGETGATVTLYDDTNNNGVQDGGEATLGTTTIASGTTFSTDISLAAGLHHVRAFQTDMAGNKSATSSASLDITVDTTAPNVSSIDNQNPASATTNADSVTFRVTFNEAVTNVSAGDFTVSGTTATITGVSQVNSNTYDVTISGGNLASLNGTVTLSFAGGQDITDTAGNALTNTTPTVTNHNTYTVDNTAPAAPTGLDLNAADDTGSSSADNITKNTSALTISGSGETGATVTLYDDTNNNGVQDGGEATLGTTTIASGTTFSTDISLAAGLHHVRAFQTDMAGNKSATSSASLDITVDTTAPNVSSIDNQNPASATTNADSVTFRVTFNEAVTNVSAGDFTVSGTTATITGVSQVNSNTYDVTISGGNLASLNGTVTLSFAGGQDITDTAGNALTNTTPTVTNHNTYTVDNTAPAAPTGLDLNAADDTGSSSADNITKNTSALTISGSGETGATVTLYDDTNNNGVQDGGEATLGTTTIASGTTFSTDISLAAGLHHVRAFQTDMAGNKSATSSASLDITVDTTAPIPTSTTNLVNNGNNNFSVGVTDTGGSGVVSVHVVDNTNSTSFDAALTSGSATSGTWTKSSTTQQGNNDSLTLTLTDLAGNVNVVSATAPAGVAGELVNLGLSEPNEHVGAISLLVSGMLSGWSLSEGVNNGDGTWSVQTNDIRALTITSPSTYTGALLLNVTETWTNADGSIGNAIVANNVEAYAPGTPIFAWSGNDHLTGSSGHDTFVFSQPIGDDVVHSFEVSSDVIDLISYGWQSFADVQAHTADDANGNAVITLADGQTITLDHVHAADLTAANFEFDVTPTTENPGSMTIGDGAMLPLSGVIHNTGEIDLQASGDDTLLQLIQTGITLNGGGHVVLSDDDHNVIAGTASNVTLDNVDNLISGAGQIGQGSLTLSNEGTIDATGTHALVIDTGANVIANAGTLEATGAGGLVLASVVANSGLIWANGGTVTAEGEVTGNGSALISGAGTIEFGSASAAGVTFDTTAAGHLILDDAFHFSGTVSGLDGNDDIDIKGISFGAGTTHSFTENQAGTGGTLTVSDGAHTANIVLLGQYDPNGFAEKAGTTNGTLITYDPHHIA
ncbi:Ig-like domain-containing protein [Bradyrhizobium sp. USDA 3364]